MSNDGERTWARQSIRVGLRCIVNGLICLERTCSRRTGSTDTNERRLYPHLPFAQLLWWRRYIMLDSDVFFAIIPCGTHLVMFSSKFQVLVNARIEALQLFSSHRAYSGQVGEDRKICIVIQRSADPTATTNSGTDSIYLRQSE